MKYPIPRATYRLQLTASFGFREGKAITDYLDQLGISHVYTSPYLKARAHSTHGYDVVDHRCVQPELGGEDALHEWLDELRSRGMGQIIDFVPNHMAVGRDDNPWWLDVLEWGQRSPYAEFFDIDWSPGQPDIAGKVLVPFLGDFYGKVLERCELKLVWEEGGFSVRYYEHRFPISPPTYPSILTGAFDRCRKDLSEELQLELGLAVARFRELAALEKDPHFDVRARGIEAKEQFAQLVEAHPEVRRIVDEAIREHCGSSEEPHTFQKLHDLLEAQSYRLAHWRVAGDEINYRRFFDINELAALRTELPIVFEKTHEWVKKMIRAGRIQGVRIDHIDGLYDPQGYLMRLRQLAGDVPLYVVVEKILADHESLRSDWPVQGSTGYDFINQVNGLFVDGTKESDLDRVHRRFGGAPDFDIVARDAKRYVIKHVLSGELQILAGALNRITERSWNSRDFTLHELRTALTEIVTAFPVYRTYVRDEASEEDRRDISWAVQRARKRAPAIDDSVFDFIERVLTNDLAKKDSGYSPTEVQHFLMRFQQYTGPVMAKAVEDTAFYRWGRLLSLNEVGGNPQRFGVSPAAFHAMNQQRLARWPHGMITLSTHDAKRGADARARIDVLSEIPFEWGRRVARWNRINRFRRVLVDGRLAPTDSELYALYQTLLGSWPAELFERPRDDEVLAPYRERIKAYLVKALREAKQRSSWFRPALGYEDAVQEFVEKILSPSEKNKFLDDFVPFVRHIASFGALNGISQVVLQLTCPGVPDLYQGTELWDLNLVDPDNRRPVDFDLRRKMLAEILNEERSVEGFEARLRNWTDGRIKMMVIHRLLQLRRTREELFARGDYTPCEVVGPRSEHLSAFVRRCEGSVLIVIASRLLYSAAGGELARALDRALWRGTKVKVPYVDTSNLEEVLTGRRFDCHGEIEVDAPWIVLSGGT